MKRGYQCAAHKHKGQVPQEDHHIWPKEFGGLNKPDNLVRICSNAHGDVHYYLNLLLVHDGLVPRKLWEQFGIGIKRIALQGYNQFEQFYPGITLAMKPIAQARLDEAPPEIHEMAWRGFSVVYRGCPFGSHGPGEPHHYTCHVMED